MQLTWFFTPLCALFSFSSFAALLINGAGSTFAAPLYSKWIVEYRNIDKSIEINYQPIGSGGGVRQFTAGTLDFGASDDPMTDDEIKKVDSPVTHIPVAMGAVVLTYNIPGVGKDLHVTSDVVANIYMGKITNWNDKQIQDLNPKIKLPSKPIVVAFRADGSGTTAVFTDYLSSNNKTWSTSVGKGKSVKFPVGIGGKGNEGVTGIIRQNPGAIGYIELTYARLNNLTVAKVKNKAGQFIEPTLESVAAAAAGLKSIPADLRVSILNSAAKAAYPISSPTYLLLKRKMDPAKGKGLVEFIKWSLGPGQDLAKQLHYSALPDALREKALAAVQKAVAQ